MAYTPHMLVAFGGDWNGILEEVWQCTIRTTSDGGSGSVVAEDAYLSSIQGPLATWFAATGNHMNTLARLKWIKANHVGADGRYLDTGTTHQYTYATPVSGPTAQYALAVTCVVYTFRTAEARGPGHIGRMYPPNYPAQVSTDPFRIALSPGANGHADAALALLGIIHNAAGPASTHPVPSVCSRIDGSINKITGVDVDTVVDVQRRRKNRIPGTRTTVRAVTW